MARSRRARGVGPPVRPFVLDDVTPASPPSAPPAASDLAETERPRANLDERVRRWLKERERYERRRAAGEAAEPPVGTGSTSK